MLFVFVFITRTRASEKSHSIFTPNFGENTFAQLKILKSHKKNQIKNNKTVNFNIQRPRARNKKKMSRSFKEHQLQLLLGVHEFLLKKVIKKICLPKVFCRRDPLTRERYVCPQSEFKICVVVWRFEVQAMFLSVF